MTKILMSELTEDEKAILPFLGSEEQDAIPFMKTVAEQAGISLKAGLRAGRGLVDKKICEYGPLLDQDTGAPHGSAYFLTTTGRLFRDEEQEAAKKGIAK